MSSEFAEEVFRVRQEHQAVFPSKQKIYRFVDDLVELLDEMGGPSSICCLTAGSCIDEYTHAGQLAEGFLASTPKGNSKQVILEEILS